MTVPVIAIVGPSGGGKTRVATALVQTLSARGYHIAAVKHTPHGHQVDLPAKDSFRLWESGAAKVMVSSPGQVTTVERTKEDTPLEKLAALVNPSYHLLVAEGFKSSTVPKVLVLRQKANAPHPPNIIALVCDHTTEQEDTDVPHFTFQELDNLATHIQSRLIDGAPKGRSISLQIEGEPVSLAPFPSRALQGVVLGFLAALRDTPQAPKTVHIAIDNSTGLDSDTASPRGGAGINLPPAKDRKRSPRMRNA